MKEVDFYTKKLEDGKISRREFMGRAVALGVAVGLASTMADKAMAASPKKGGHLRYGVGEWDWVKRGLLLSPEDIAE